MSDPFIEKLERLSVLTAADRDALQILSAKVITAPARDLLLAEGEVQRAVIIVLSGWACRFKSLPGASRQIVALLLPGDHVEASPHIAREMDSGVCTLTNCELAEVELEEFHALVSARPAVALALARSSMIEQAILREWITGLGRRPAERRMAHFFCELQVRLQHLRSTPSDGYALPLTQAALGDALGLSPAHVNRTLQSLRARKLVSLENGAVQIDDLPRLQRFSAFKPRYLDVQRTEAGAPPA